MTKRRMMFGLIVAMVAAGATAGIVTYYFSGTFQTQFGTAPAGMAGTPFAGSLDYDPAAAVDSSTADSIVYAPGSASISIQTVFGNGQTNTGSGQMSLLWDATIASQLGGLFSPADQFAAGAAASFDGGLSVFQLLGMQLVDGTGGAADDPFGTPGSPVPSALLLSEIDSASVTLFAAGTVGGVFQTVASAVGSLDCLSTDRAECTLQSVPEPATLALLSLGLAGLAASRRRKLN